MPAHLGDAAPLIALPLSLETKRSLIHERVLVAQALVDGLRASHGAGQLWLHEHHPAPTGPAVVIGYPRALKAAIQTRDGRLTLAGRPIHAAVRDLFCQHLVDRHPDVAPDSFLAVNALYPLCASKARTYALYNEYLVAHPSDLLWRPVDHRLTPTRAALIDHALTTCARGQSLVIKPHASGAARGVEFLRAGQPEAALIARIDAAIADAERPLDDTTPRPAFPYVACELLTGRTVDAPDHPLHGHRWELRILVHRVQDHLHVFPAVCKLSGARYDPAAPAREMLLNTVSADAAGNGGGHLLPLTNGTTLKALGLDVRTLATLCQFSLRFVAHAIASA